MTQIDFDHIRWPLCGTQLKAAPWNWHGNEFAFLLLARFELYVPHAPPLSFSDTPRALSVALFSIHFPPLFSHSHTRRAFTGGGRVNFNSLAQSSGVQIGNPAVFAWRERAWAKGLIHLLRTHPPAIYGVPLCFSNKYTPVSGSGTKGWRETSNQTTV